jgi:hypothetical protein
MWGSILNGVLNNADTIANVGRVASGAAQGSAEQRVNEADARVRADQLTRRSQLLAALLGGLQDARVTSGNPNIRARTPQVSGGFRPSAMLGDGRREALMQILSRPVEFPEAGAAERILGGVGIGAGLLGAATSGRR